MANNDDEGRLADFLSDLSVAVVVALQTHDEEALEELSSELARLETEFAEDQPELATYFQVLRGLVQGEEVDPIAENLVEPYRSGYERVLQELEKEPEVTQSEWLTNLTSLVATTAKHGSREVRVKLEKELVHIAERVPAEETEFHDFIAALRGVLRGEDTRELALKVRPPYREAYQSLLQLLSAEDTTDFTVRTILEKIEHNVTLALSRGDPEVRLAVAEALADIEEKLPEDEPTTYHFRALILGTMALLIDREVPDAVNSLPDPFAETWENIRAAAEQ